ncbi:PREDICTED: basic salivary proline-rich protein 2-like, partial [Chinchilla lanigera]|uniref:basic salivary proline-rich protein 2-like n=1 Tax=Chinchilla lanigera TaxID=34839 RepID=UPI0006984C8B
MTNLPSFLPGTHPARREAGRRRVARPSLTAVTHVSLSQSHSGHPRTAPLPFATWAKQAWAAGGKASAGSECDSGLSHCSQNGDLAPVACDSDAPDTTWVWGARRAGTTAAPGQRGRRGPPRRGGGEAASAGPEPPVQSARPRSPEQPDTQARTLAHSRATSVPPTASPPRARPRGGRRVGAPRPRAVPPASRSLSRARGALPRVTRSVPPREGDARGGKRAGRRGQPLAPALGAPEPGSVRSRGGRRAGGRCRAPERRGRGLAGHAPAPPRAASALSAPLRPRSAPVPPLAASLPPAWDRRELRTSRCPLLLPRIRRARGGVGSPGHPPPARYRVPKLPRDPPLGAEP